MKKVVCLFITVLLIICLSIPAFAIDDAPSSYTVGVIQESALASKKALLSANNALSISELNKLSETELQKYDLITLDKPLLASLNKDTAMTFLQTGGVLSVDTSSTDEALSTLYNLLNVEKPITITTTGLEHIGAYIFMRNGVIVPGIITEGTVSLRNTKEVTATHASPVSTERESLCNKIDVKNFLDHVTSTKSSPFPANTSGTQYTPSRMAPSNYTTEFDNYTTIKFSKMPNNSIGSVYITQYIYHICDYRSGSNTVSISDVVSHIAVDACKYSYVKTYSAKIQVNSIVSSIIDQTYLRSDSSQTISLSGGFSANTDDVLTGELGASTSYTYDTNNQEITNNFTSNTCNCWHAVPTMNWPDASWVLEPGVRVKNGHASVHTTSAYTSVEDIAFKWHYMGAQAGTEVYSLPLTVGGYW